MYLHHLTVTNKIQFVHSCISLILSAFLGTWWKIIKIYYICLLSLFLLGIPKLITECFLLAQESYQFYVGSTFLWKYSYSGWGGSSPIRDNSMNLYGFSVNEIPKVESTQIAWRGWALNRKRSNPNRRETKQQLFGAFKVLFCPFHSKEMNP